MNTKTMMDRMNQEPADKVLADLEAKYSAMKESYKYQLIGETGCVLATRYCETLTQFAELEECAVEHCYPFFGVLRSLRGGSYYGVRWEPEATED